MKQLLSMKLDSIQFLLSFNVLSQTVLLSTYIWKTNRTRMCVPFSPSLEVLDECSEICVARQETTYRDIHHSDQLTLKATYLHVLTRLPLLLRLKQSFNFG